MDRKNVYNNILQGLATILWGDAWAQHIETALEEGRQPCRKLSGCKIESLMPEIPREAWQAAKKLAMEIYKSNGGKSILNICQMAYAADTAQTSPSLTYIDALNDYECDGFIARETFGKSYQVRLGECLAWMSLGAGVSWFDDHQEFTLKIPRTDNFDLQILALSSCPECQVLSSNINHNDV